MSGPFDHSTLSLTTIFHFSIRSIECDWVSFDSLLLGVLAFSFSVFFFFFSLVRRGARADTKIWLVTAKVIASCIPQVLTKSLLLFSFFLTILHIIKTLLGSTNLSFSFVFFRFSSTLDRLIFFFFFSFAFLQSLIDWFFFLFLFFCLTHTCNPR